MDTDAFLAVTMTVTPGAGVSLQICVSAEAWMGVLWRSPGGALAIVAEPALLRAGDVLQQTYETDAQEDGHLVVGASPGMLDLDVLGERLGGAMGENTRAMGPQGIRLQQALVMAAVVGLAPAGIVAGPAAGTQNAVLEAQPEPRPPPPPPPRPPDKEPPAPGTTPWEKRPIAAKDSYTASLEQGLALVMLPPLHIPPRSE